MEPCQWLVTQILPSVYKTPVGATAFERSRREAKSKPIARFDRHSAGVLVMLDTDTRNSRQGFWWLWCSHMCSHFIH